MNKNTWTILLLLVAILLFLTFIPSVENFVNNANEAVGGDSSTLYSTYFTPWWQSYFGPYYGTSSTSYDQLLNWPYDSYYNYNSYWRRPLFYNYFRMPYYYRRKVYRPYVQDSIEGRRDRLQRFDFGR